MTDTTNQAGYRGVWATFQGIQIDTKLAAIQKLQALGISSEQKWWSDMEFLAHRLKFGRIEHIIITVRVLPNEPLRLCFMGIQPSLDPDVTCDVQMSKNAVRTDLTGMLSKHIYAPDLGPKLPSKVISDRTGAYVAKWSKSIELSVLTKS